MLFSILPIDGSCFTSCISRDKFPPGKTILNINSKPDTPRIQKINKLGGERKKLKTVDKDIESKEAQ